KKIADGDLTIQFENNEKATGVYAAMEHMVGNLSNIVSSVTDAASDLNRGAIEISRGNTELRKRSEHQSNALKQATTNMEAIAEVVQSNADNARNANELSTVASEQAESGGKVVNNAVRAMAAINDSSHKIADITNVIDEIAFQTNLLALNAAVEAARAGEQGRGFAVVAGEVRTLAQRSSKAASEINALITDSVDKIKDGTDLVNNSGKTLEEIVASVTRVSSIIADISETSDKQAKGIGEIDRVIKEIGDMTQQNNGLVEQTASSSKVVEGSANHLSQLMTQFKLAK
ncbi:MAG: methyl-accepting chemotaxis protein, partial [Granulosicoccaceae bacterium]